MKWSEAYKHAGLGVWVPIKLIHAIGAKSAIFTSQLFYWTGKERNGDGWVYKTKDEWEMETGLSRREQDTCVEDLKRKKILETRYERLEHRLYYRVSEEALDAIMEAASPGESTKAPFGKGGKRLSPKADSVFRHIDQRLPSENTTKTVQGESRLPAKRLVRRTRRLDSSSSSFCVSAKPEESQPPAITTQPAAEPAPSGVGLTPEKETARPLLTFGPTEDDSPREVAEKLIEKYELSDYQGGQIEDYIAKDGFGYVMEKIRLTDSEPRENAGRYFMAALRDDFKAPKRTVKPKAAKSSHQKLTEAEPPPPELTPEQAAEARAARRAALEALKTEIKG
jgi:hypothetical protein